MKKENTFDLAFELAKSLRYSFIEERRINKLRKSVTRKIDFLLNGQLNVFCTQVINKSVSCAQRNLKQRMKKITQVFQRKIVKVVGKVFAVNMHCVFVSIIITVQINFI